MNEDRYVAGIEISSSKIIAVVGKYRETGQLDIIACEQDSGVEGVRYGVIQNLEETSLRIQRLLEKIQRRPSVAPREITGLFVGLSGRSVKSIPTDVSINLPEETEITEEILDQLHKLALETAIDSSLEVVDAIPRKFTVGKLETSSPKGAVGNKISAKYDLIVSRQELKRNLVRTIQEKLGIRIEGIVVTALATSQLILTAEEKRLGCMLVDMGAETTTVTIYKDGALKYFATLPLGGRNITRDITILNILEERAEDLKLTSGNAIARENPSSLNFNGIKVSDLSNLIVSRSEEIVANIVEQISYAELKESDLPGGIICIGGGSKLNGMLELLGNQSGMNIRRGQMPSYIRIEDTKAPSLEIIEVGSVLYLGSDNSTIECLEMPHTEELPITGIGNQKEEEKQDEETKQVAPSKSSKWLGKLRNKVSNFFSNPEDDDSDLLE